MEALKPRPWDEAVLDAFQPVVAGNPWGALQSAGELLHGSHLFEYRQGRQHALVAALPLQYSGGRRVEIVALRSLGDRLQAGPFIDSLRNLGHAFDANLLAMSTGVPHVVNTCQRHGWVPTGTLMQLTIGSYGRTQ